MLTLFLLRFPPQIRLELQRAFLGSFIERSSRLWDTQLIISLSTGRHKREPSRLFMGAVSMSSTFSTSSPRFLPFSNLTLHLSQSQRDGEVLCTSLRSSSWSKRSSKFSAASERSFSASCRLDPVPSSPSSLSFPLGSVLQLD